MNPTDTIDIAIFLSQKQASQKDAAGVIDSISGGLQSIKDAWSNAKSLNDIKSQATKLWADHGDRITNDAQWAGGGALAGGLGSLATSYRRPGESEEDYRSRRFRETAMAALGGAAIGGVGREGYRYISNEGAKHSDPSIARRIVGQSPSGTAKPSLIDLANTKDTSKLMAVAKANPGLVGQKIRSEYAPTGDPVKDKKIMEQTAARLELKDHDLHEFINGPTKAPTSVARMVGLGDINPLDQQADGQKNTLMAAGGGVGVLSGAAKQMANNPTHKLTDTLTGKQDLTSQINAVTGVQESVPRLDAFGKVIMNGKKPVMDKVPLWNQPNQDPALRAAINDWDAASHAYNNPAPRASRLGSVFDHVMGVPSKNTPLSVPGTSTEALAQKMRAAHQGVLEALQGPGVDPRLKAPGIIPDPAVVLRSGSGPNSSVVSPLQHQAILGGGNTATMKVPASGVSALSKASRINNLKTMGRGVGSGLVGTGLGWGLGNILDALNVGEAEQIKNRGELNWRSLGND